MPTPIKMGRTFPRVEFEEAITEPLLFKKQFDGLSSPQQTALKIFYGLPLDAEELNYWAMFQGGATYDDLGFVKSIDKIPLYVPQVWDEAWLVWGRRSAKTSGFLSFVMAYEALLGGHTQYASPKQEVVSFMVAQKLDVAQAIIRDFIEPLVSASKLLEKEIVKSNSDGLFFQNGHRIAPAPPVIKNFRYYAIPIVGMDEAAFWYKDAEAANPDYEVVRAVEPAQGQFPNHKLVGGSTPWGKEGLIWEAANAGTNGSKLPDDDERKAKFKNTLVMIAPTPALQNPLYSDRKWFERQARKDPEAYKRETLVQFVDSIAGFFPESLLRKAIEGAPLERPYDERQFYVATMDPAFRMDDFAFTIGHYEQSKGFVQDVLKVWSPKESRLNPITILDEIKVLIDKYHTEVVYSDQYNLESLQQLALERNFSIVGQDFTANSKSRMFGSFIQLLRNDRISLLRNHDQFQQFLWIQKMIGNGGYIRISAPAGKHDDMVTCTVMCCSMAIRFETSDTEEHKEPAEQTPFQRIMASIAAKKGDKGLDKEWL